MFQRSRHDMPIVKKGYKRMLLSYLPLVFVAISAVVFISFIVVTDMTVREAERADRLSTRQIAGTIETSVQDIERTVLQELAVNRSLYSFLNADPADDERLIQYELSEDLQKLRESSPSIQSVYVYRAADGKVLTEREIVPLVRFADKEFVAAQLHADRTQKWLPVRMFRDSELNRPEAVTSYIQRFPLPLGSDGIVVVNVNVGQLVGETVTYNADDLSILDIRDSRTGARLNPANGVIDPAASAPAPDRNVLSFAQQSPYLGWTFYSGIQKGPLSAWVSVISYVWVGIGVFVLAGSLFAFVYMAKRNYRPVELLLARIQQFPLQQLPKQKAADEFAYIERALEALVETNRKHEQLQQDGWTAGKRQFIRDWLDGTATVDSAEWQEKAAYFEIPPESAFCQAAIVQVEGFLPWQRQEEREKRLLKFSLANYILEQLREFGHLETEWIEADKLALLILRRERASEGDVAGKLNEIVGWTGRHLNLRIWIGTGLEAVSQADAAVSFRQAFEALGYKLLLGRVAAYADVSARRQPSAFAYYQRMAECVQQAYGRNDGWSGQADAIFEQMKADLLADEEIKSIILHGTALLLEEAECVADPEVRSRLREIVLSLQRLTEQETRMASLQAAFAERLERFSFHYANYKKSNKYQETINRVKRHIEQHFNDPDLSLTQISEMFGLKPKYASQLFKDEFGMKFVDFVVMLRMEEAKRRLVATDDPVQDIALQVGYATPISFGRMFKKLEGVPPGDYRKMKLRATQPNS